MFDRHGVLRGAVLLAFVLALLLPMRLAAVPPLDGPRVFLQKPDALAAAKPLELARTNAWSYSNGNLDGLTELATLGDRAGVDLWHYATGDGRSIRKAILYLALYSFGEKKWDSQQIGTFNPQALHGVLRRAATRYDDAEFQSAVKRLPALAPAVLANR